MSFAEFIGANAQLTHRVLLYGPPKIGKTAAVGLLAKHMQVYVVDGERGGSVFANPELALKDHWGNIKYFPVQDSHSLPLFAETMVKVVESIGKKSELQICKAHGKVGRCMDCGNEESKYQLFDFFSDPSPEKILAVDSATQLGNSILAMVMKVAGRGAVTAKAEFDDWGNQGKYLNYIFSAFQGLNLNIIVISHDSQVEMEDKRIILSPTAGTKNFSMQVARYFGHVVYGRKTLAAGHTGASSTGFSQQIQVGSRTGATVEDFTVPGESILLPIFKPELAAKLQAEYDAKKKAAKK